MSVSGYLYLIHVREFINSGQTIYKFGRSFDVHSRLQQYPNKSECLFYVKTKDHVKAERELIYILSSDFVRRRDIGLEYFEGDCHQMITTIVSYVTKTDSKVVPSKPIDVDMYVHEFMWYKQDELKGRDICTKQLYEQYKEWGGGKIWYRSHRWFSREVSNMIESHPDFSGITLKDNENKREIEPTTIATSTPSTSEPSTSTSISSITTQTTTEAINECLTCERCGYMANRKNHLKKHLKKQNACDAIHSDVQRSVLLERLTKRLPRSASSMPTPMPASTSTPMPTSTPAATIIEPNNLRLTCKRCGYTTDRKQHLQNHLKKQKACNAIHSDVDPSVLLDKLSKPLPRTKRGDPTAPSTTSMTTHTMIDCNNTKEYVCGCCKKTYATSWTLKRHELTCLLKQISPIVQFIKDIKAKGQV